MFQSAYQGGDCVEVFSPAGKQPVEHWKLTGKCGRMYDKGVKGYVLAVVGGAGSKMQAPKAPKATLGLRQRHLVLQVLTASSEGKSFSVELGLTDAGGTRRRLVLSSAFRVVHCTPLHAQIPLPGLRQRRGSWANLSIDMGGLMAMCFKAETFRSLDLVAIGPVCRVRKIFTMRGALDRSEGLDADPDVFRGTVSGSNADDNDALSSAPVEPLPPRMAFPAGVIPTPNSWVISPSTLRALVSRDPLPISSPRDRNSLAPPSSRAFSSPIRLRSDEPLTTSALRSTPTPQGGERSSLSIRNRLSVRGVRGAQSPGRACSRAGARAAALATPERKSDFGRATPSTRSHQDPLPQSSASERSIPLPELRSRTSRGSGRRTCVTRRASVPSPAGRPPSSIPADLGAGGFGVEGTSWRYPNTLPGAVAWEKEGTGTSAATSQTTPSLKVLGWRRATVGRGGASNCDVFDDGRNGLPTRRRALEIASVGPTDLASNRYPASGRIFADCNLNDRGHFASEDSREVEPGEPAGSGLRGPGGILGGSDSTTPRRRTPREDAETGVDSLDLAQEKLAPLWSTNDGLPLESDRPRRINTPRQPSCLSMRGKKPNSLAAALQTDGAVFGRSGSSPSFSESAEAGGVEALPLSRDVRTSHVEARRQRSPVCTAPDIFLPRDLGALSLRSDEGAKGDFISEKRPTRVAPFHSALHTAVPSVASGASLGDVFSRRGDGFTHDETFNGDRTSHAHSARPAHSDQNGTPSKSGDVMKTNFTRGRRGRNIRSFTALPATGYGAAGSPSHERIDALQVPLASSPLEKDLAIGFTESVSPPGAGGAFEASASRRERGYGSGVGGSSGGSPVGDDVLEHFLSQNDAPDSGHSGCRDVRMIDLDNFESNNDGRRGGGVVASAADDNAVTPAIDGGCGDGSRVIQSAPERPTCNIRSKMDLAISPKPQGPSTSAVYERLTGLAGDGDRRELEKKELALFDLENSYRSEFGSINSSQLPSEERVSPNGETSIALHSATCASDG